MEEEVENDLEFLNNLPVDRVELKIKVNGLIFQEKETLERLELRLRQLSVHESSKNEKNEEEEGEGDEKLIDIDELRKKWDEVVDDTLIDHIKELKKLKNEHVQLEKMHTLFEDLDTLNRVLSSVNENSLEDVYKLTDIFSTLNPYPNVQKWAMKKIHAVLNMIGQNLQKSLRENLKKLNWGIAKFSLPKSSDFQEFTSNSITRILKGLVNLQVIKKTCTVHSELQQRKFVESATILDVLEDLAFEILLRMNFHFFGDKNTNRSDRPSFIFSYVQLLRESYLPIIHLWMNPIIRDLYKYKSHLFDTDDDHDDEEEKNFSSSSNNNNNNNRTTKKKIGYFIEPTIGFTNLIHKVVIKRLRKQLGVLSPLILSRMVEEDEEESQTRTEFEDNDNNKGEDKKRKKRVKDDDDDDDSANDRTDEDLFMSWMNHAIEYEKRILEEFSYFGSPFDRGLESIVTEVLRSSSGGNVGNKPKKSILLCFLWLERERIVEMVRKVYSDWKPYHDYDDEEEIEEQDRISLFSSSSPSSSSSSYNHHHHQQQQRGGGRGGGSSGEFMYSLKPSKSAYKVIHTLSLLNERYKLITLVKTRKRFYEEIHCYVLRDFLRFFSNNLDRHLSSNVEEEEMEWRYFCSMINSTLYCETNLRLWDKIPQIMDFSTLKNKEEKKKIVEEEEGEEEGENEGLERKRKESKSIYYFSDLADRFVICADMMTRNLIRSVMDYVKYYLANKYERKLMRKRLEGNNSEITTLAKNVKKILMVCELNLERIRFNKIWRNLAEQVDLFFLNHFKIKDESDVDYEIRYQLLKDIKTFFEIVFSTFTRRPLNFAKRTKLYIQKMN